MTFQTFADRAMTFSDGRAKLLAVGLASLSQIFIGFLSGMTRRGAFWRQFRFVLLHARAGITAAGFDIRTKLFPVGLAGFARSFRLLCGKRQSRETGESKNGNGCKNYSHRVLFQFR